MTLTLAVLVGALALTSRQGAPPTIAEFAPQAVEQITDSSNDAAGTSGGASGETSAVSEQDGANGPAQQTVDVARVRQCVGDPPRQIEDPQSPPCVPYWSGDNGGATWRGVTRDEIRVTNVLHGYGFGPQLEAFFNSRFEFYGRRMRLIPRDIPADGDQAGQRAAARAVYEEDKAFASMVPGHAVDYLTELARLGIVGLHWASMFPEAYLAAHRPYMWQYPMANDIMFASAGNWYCARFAGRDAIHAGDPLMQLTRRKPGIILTEAGTEGTSAEPMNAQLAACGDRTDAVLTSTVQAYDYAYYASFMENAILQMKTSGVTSLACLCNAIYVGFAMRAATNQGYFPEWLLTSYFSNDSGIETRVYDPPEQRKHLMLLLAHPMHRPSEQHPSTWALQERTNTYPTTTLDQWFLDFVYRTLLLLAAGFQMAGPHLTPEAFESGLHQTTFPNPAHRIMAGAVGFKDRDHTMTDDSTEVWWSDTAQSPYPKDGPGTFCYVDHGARRRIGTFPTDDPFFKEPCDNGTT